jgi:nitroreductase
VRIGTYSLLLHTTRYAVISVNTVDLHKAIYERRAVREYSDSAVDHAVIDRLIDAAVQAPTALNQQPWIFTVVRDQRKLDQLSSQAKAYMLADHADMVRGSHLQMLNDPHYQIFYRAPVLILLSAAAPGPWCIEDCALAAQNLMLAAYGEGLGSCWIGFAQAYLGTPAGKALLHLPSACVPVAPIIVGVPRGAAPAISRKKAEVTWVG